MPSITMPATVIDLRDYRHRIVYRRQPLPVDADVIVLSANVRKLLAAIEAGFLTLEELEYLNSLERLPLPRKPRKPRRPR